MHEKNEKYMNSFVQETVREEATSENLCRDGRISKWVLKK
jgi:hypothetical protein